MAEKALSLAELADHSAQKAESTISTHLAVCEQQNLDILRRLGNQDKMLYAIIAGIFLEVFHLIVSKLLS